jgi:hypothetical protein
MSCWTTSGLAGHHGNGVGWTTAVTCVIVAQRGTYGLFAGIWKYEVIWNGAAEGRLSERDAVRPAEPVGVDGGSSVNGWAAFVADTVTSFSGYGMGSYSFQPGRGHLRRERLRGPRRLPASSLHDLLTIFLDPSVGRVAS